MNCYLFTLQENWAYIYKMKEGEIVGSQRNQFKLPKQKKARVTIQIVSSGSGGDLEFRVNDIQALKCRYSPI
jgi:hypothetical protein